MGKPILCLDFDGVIHSYASGWQGPAVVADPPVDGAIEALLGYTDSFRVCIHSSRFSRINGDGDGDSTAAMVAVFDWLVRHGVPADRISVKADEILCCAEDLGTICLVSTKPAAFVTLDDRAITFTGTWPLAGDLLAFRPWNKKSNV